MTEFESKFYDLLTEIMDLIGRTEEEALIKGEFNNLSRSEMHTLQSIGIYETRSMGETAQILGVTTGTLTVQINRLVRKGYVERHRKTEDRRVMELRLTRDGRLACRMHNRFNRLLLQNMLEPLETEEQELLFRSMQRIDLFLKDQYKKYSEREVRRHDQITEGHS